MASSNMNSAGKATLLGKREPEDDLETKQILKKHKETSEEKETKSDHANLIPRKETVEILDETPDFVEEVSVREKKTLSVNHLFVSRLSSRTIISDIINFFEDVGQVVSVKLAINREGKPWPHGIVEFASANEAKKALEKKTGEYLHDLKISLGIAKTAAFSSRPKYCIYHKVGYNDYLLRQSLQIEEEETPPDFVEAVGLIQAVAVRKKTLFVANLSPQTKILHIFDFFNDVGEVVSVRLIVNPEGKHVGYGFVEFASPYQAKMVRVAL